MARKQRNIPPFRKLRQQPGGKVVVPLECTEAPAAAAAEEVGMKEDLQGWNADRNILEAAEVPLIEHKGLAEGQQFIFRRTIGQKPMCAKDAGDLPCMISVSFRPAAWRYQGVTQD